MGTPGKRILLTGASGEIGTPLLDALEDAGHELHILTRQADPPSETGRRRWVKGDLRDPASLDRAVACAPEAVVHLAAVTHARRQRDYDAVNVAGTGNLIAALAAVPVAHFVHLSTRAIGVAGGGYAASKAQAEAVVRASGLPWTILRPAEVYGSGGEDPIRSLARDLRRRSFVPVLGDGSYTLSPVLAADVVAAIRASLAVEARGQTYLLAGPEELTYLELIARLEQILGLPRRRRVRVPLALARGLIRGLSSFGLGSYVPDQIPRLLLPKETDSGAARRDLGFDPVVLAAGPWLSGLG